MKIEFKIADDVNYYDPENTMTEQEYDSFLAAYMRSLKNAIEEYYNDGSEDHEVIVEKNRDGIHEIRVYDTDEDEIEVAGECSRISQEVFSSMEY